MQKKYLIWIAIAVLLIPLLYCLGWMFGPGSYPRAERYEFGIPEVSLISIINQIKDENPELGLTEKVLMPTGGTVHLNDGRKDSTDFWYHIYFYYPDKNQIIHTWTRPNSNNSTTFAFVGINDGLTLGNWKQVNNSFWWWKNRAEKAEFENRILKLIEKQMKARHSTVN